MRSQHDLQYLFLLATAFASTIGFAACGPATVSEPGTSGDASSSDASSGDGGTGDTVFLDRSQPDAFTADAHRNDAWQTDASTPDATRSDAQQLDSRDPDASSPDMSSPDTIPNDAQQPDTRSPDGNLSDVQQPDAYSADTRTQDSRVDDSAVPDGHQPDVTTVDASQPDASQPDASQPDGATPDSAQVPSEWVCPERYYGDSDCDCGCGIIDSDCSAANRLACEYDHCPQTTTISLTQNWLCDLHPDWTCTADLFLDGKCDCGCGAPDLDCMNGEIETCDQTHCGPGTTVVPTRNWSCDWQSDWACPTSYFGDGDCDCGCGAIDIDCSGLTIDVCDYSHCPENSSTAPTQNWQCYWDTTWLCDPTYYGDGSCDCGCGIQDSDCSLASSDVCSASACGDAITNPFENWLCVEDWSCLPSSLGDGVCDCGCGAIDVDCVNGLLPSCQIDHCPTGFRANLVNNAQCMQLPGWTCPETQWGDGVCDCGCGAADIDCPDDSAASCERVDCANGVPLPDANWQCSDRSDWTCAADRYDDAVCDCGCGTLDMDCYSAESYACDRYQCSEVADHRNWLCTEDADGPVVVIDTPTADQIFTQPDIVVSGVATDPSGIYRVTVNYLEAERSWESGDDMGWRRPIVLDQGQNTLEIRVEDNNANVTRINLTVLYLP